MAIPEKYQKLAEKLVSAFPALRVERFNKDRELLIVIGGLQLSITPREQVGVIQEMNLKHLAVAAGLAMGSFGARAQAPAATTSVVQGAVLARVQGPVGRQPVGNPDLDMVHGILGSKRLQDDFERRVSAELQRQYQLGHNPMVTNLRIGTRIQGGQIVTESGCDVVESTDGKAYTAFTTRGSIGQDYDQRHDQQVSGLAQRLTQAYGGEVKTYGPYAVDFTLGGQMVGYKQSFFAATDSRYPAHGATGSAAKTIRKTLRNADYTLLGKQVEAEVSAAFAQLGGGELTHYSVSYSPATGEWGIAFAAKPGEYTGFTRRGHAEVSADGQISQRVRADAQSQATAAVQRLLSAGYGKVTPLSQVNGGENYATGAGPNGKAYAILDVPIQLKK